MIENRVKWRGAVQQKNGGNAMIPFGTHLTIISATFRELCMRK
jgi:hypothetical protein